MRIHRIGFFLCKIRHILRLFSGWNYKTLSAYAITRSWTTDAITSEWSTIIFNYFLNFLFSNVDNLHRSRWRSSVIYFSSWWRGNSWWWNSKLQITIFGDLSYVTFLNIHLHASLLLQLFNFLLKIFLIANL